MKKLLLFSFIILSGAFLVFGCKKSNSVDNASAIVGKWRYAYSTADTMINGHWVGQQSGFDSTLGANFADSLQFTASDTVYYIYNGMTTWSNYKVSGSNLVLIGNGGNDTLAIHSISSTALWVGVQSSTYYYWAGFSKYQ